VLNLLVPGLVNTIWFPDSVERFSVVWVSRLGVLSLGVSGVVFLLVVRCLGKYY